MSDQRLNLYVYKKKFEENTKRIAPYDVRITTELKTLETGDF